MRKFITVLASIVLLSGCFDEKGESGSKEMKHAVEIREVFKKQIDDLELLWELIDGRNEQVLRTIYLPDVGYERGKKLEIDKVTLIARQLANEIDQPLVNPTITREGEIIEGKNKVILAENELIDQIMSLAYYNKRLVVPIYEEQPKVTIYDLENIKTILLSSYSTHFNPNVTGRSKNIKLSSQAIDHYVIGPGEEFSFNKVVGQRTKERGYQEAKEIVNKQFVVGIGGGICQTSSTLFNAIDKAGLEVIERHTHSRDIGYVPKSRDATVSWGGPDFKFKNPYSFPLLISTETNIQSGKIEVQVYGPHSQEHLLATSQ